MGTLFHFAWALSSAPPFSLRLNLELLSGLFHLVKFRIYCLVWFISSKCRTFVWLGSSHLNSGSAAWLGSLHLNFDLRLRQAHDLQLPLPKYIFF